MDRFGNFFDEIFDFDGDGIISAAEELIGFAFLEEIAQEQDDGNNLLGGDAFYD